MAHATSRLQRANRQQLEMAVANGRQRRRRAAAARRTEHRPRRWAHVREQRVVRDATPAVEVAGSKGPVQLGKKFRLLGREDRGDSPGIG